jgi:acylphosphatase
MNKEFHVFFSGAVQGVGFRFTTKSLANQNNVKGWVRNLPDGRVEVLAQSQDKNLSNFINELKSRFSRYISGVEITEDAATKDYTGFKIKF